MGVDKHHRPILAPSLTTGPVTADSLTVDPETIYTVLRLIDARVHDAIKTGLPDAAAADDLGLAQTVDSHIRGQDAAGASTLGYAIWRFLLPSSYQAGGDLVLRMRAHETFASQLGALLNMSLTKILGDASEGPELASGGGAALGVTLNNHDWTIDGATLSPGDEVQIHATMSRDDTGGAQGGYAAISHASLRYPAPAIDV